MTFEEFKELALTPPYIEQESVYRVDVHCYIKSSGGWDTTETRFEVRCTQSFVFSDLSSAQCKLKQIIVDKELKETLYAVYIYQFPIGKDILNDLYQRLWVYDRFGNLNGQSHSTSILEDLDHLSAKFRGHKSEYICFKPGDIVEIYDRKHGVIACGIVAKTPLTIEECWEKYKQVEKECVAEGLSAESANDIYWVYAIDDSYLVLLPNHFPSSLTPRSLDVFPVTFPLSESLRDKLYKSYHRYASEEDEKEGKGNCSFHEVTDIL